MIILHISIPLWPTLLWILFGLIGAKIYEINEETIDLSNGDVEDVGRMILFIIAGPIVLAAMIQEYDILDNIKDPILEFIEKRHERKRKEKELYERNKREHAKPGMFEW